MLGQDNTILLSIITFLIVFSIGILLTYNTKRSKRSKNVDRLMGLKQVSDDEILRKLQDENQYSEEMKKYLYPIIKKNANSYNSLLKTFKIDINQLELEILRADKQDEMTATDLAAKKIFGMFIALACLLGGIYNPIFMALGLVVYYIFAIMPSSNLAKIHKERKYEFQQEFPFYLNLVANATAVGHSIEEAAEFVNVRHPCIIQREFQKAKAESEYSNDWINALQRRAYFADIDELEQFVSEIQIAKERGTPITDALRDLSKKISAEATIAYEENANKKASSITFPMFIFLFIPAMGAILLPMLSTALEFFG